jgi:hypothetical protein
VIITAPVVTLDGATTILVEFFCAALSLPSNLVIGSLYDGATCLSRWFDIRVAAAGSGAGQAVAARRRLTPSSGSHTYSVRSFIAGTGPAVFNAASGSGGTGTYSPTSLRVSRV